MRAEIRADGRLLSKEFLRITPSEWGMLKREGSPKHGTSMDAYIILQEAPHGLLDWEGPNCFKDNPMTY